MYETDLTLERRLQAKDKLIEELLKALQDSQQYLGKLAADHEGTFLGKSAKGRLDRNQITIREVKGE